MREKKEKKEKTSSSSRRRTEGDRSEGMNHSTYYHSYFEGYTEARVPADNRKGYKLVRVYTSDFYVSKDAHPARRKITYLIQYLAAFIAFIAAGLPASSASLTLYVILPVALSMVALVICGAVLLFYIAMPAKMTIYQHSYSQKLKLASGASSILTGICVLCMLLSFFLIADSVTVYTLLSTAGYLVSFLCLLFLNRRENEAGYTREFNPEEGPEEGNVIC